MEEKQNFFDFGTYVPIQFSIESSGPFEKHWHPQLEIAYVLYGEAEITVNEHKYHLKEDQLIVLNPYTIHSVIYKNCSMGIFLINLTMFDHTLVKDSLQIDCNSSTIADENQLYHLKHLLAQIIKSNLSVNKPKHIELLNKSLAYAIIYELAAKYGVNEDNEYRRRSNQMDRMEEIIKYIHLHFRANISLKQLSEHFFLSVPYLSRIFKTYINMNFTDYLNTLRLNQSLSCLDNPALSIDKIAELCGFPNSRSFVTAFQRKYDMYPSKYRKSFLSGQKQEVPAPAAFAQHNHLSVLAKYLDSDEPYNSRSYFPQLLQLPPIDTRQKGFPLKHNFKKMIGIGKANHLLYAEIQSILKEIQAEIGFTYITFYGLLDDDMMLYSEDTAGTPKLNFYYIDTIFDFLLSINLKPFMQLSFMPKALAETPERTMFFHPSIISLPSSIEKWCYLVSELILHLQSRYTVDEVKNWPFCVWNEPDAPITFGFKNKEEFFAFYKATFDTVKQTNPNIVFGTPALVCDTLEKMDWFVDFMNFCEANNCIPEFLNYHFFPLQLNDKRIEIDLISSSVLKYRESPDSFKDSLYIILKNLKDRNWQFPYIYISEWNSSISHQELINDTAFKASYLVKNILENYDRIDSFSYWMLSDFNDELHMSSDTYSGGLGLITSNGIKKAAYYALHLLSRLGDNLIGKGNGYFITRTDNAYQIMLYNYQHFSRLYAMGELFDLTFTNRYTPFEDPVYKKFLIPLQGLPNKLYTITETILNRGHGSSFDKWIEFGAQPLENQQEINYLQSISLPLIQKRTVMVENNHLTLSCELEPHEVRFIQITYGTAPH